MKKGYFLLLFFTMLTTLTKAQVEPHLLVQFQDEETQQYGYTDESGNIIIPAIYEEAAYRFEQGLAWVKKDGMYGFIDNSGKTVVPFKFDGFYPTPDITTHFALVNIDKKWGFINALGQETIPIKYEVGDNWQMDFDIDLPNCYISEECLLLFKSKGKFGALTQANKIAIPFEFDNIIDSRDYKWPTYIIEKKGKWALADSSGKIVTDFKYTGFLDFWSDYAMMQLKGKWIFVHTKTLQEKNSIDDIELQVKEQCFAYKGKYGVINTKGEVVVPFKYDFPLYGNVFTVAKSKLGKTVYKKGVLDNKGNEIIPAIYDEISGNYSGGYELKLNNKVGYTDSNYKIIIPVEFDDGSHCSDFYMITKGDKQAIYNKNGQPVTPFIYDDIPYCYGELLAVSQNGKWGFIDKAGNVKIPIIYDDVLSGFSDTVTPVKLKGKIGFINLEGKTVIDFLYDEIDNTYNSFYRYDFVKIRRGDKWVNVNRDGKEF